MRLLSLLMMLVLAAPAHAGWRGSFDFGLSPAMTSNGVVPLQMASQSSFSPWEAGPLISVGANLDLLGDPKLSRHGVGFTLPVGRDFAVGSQVQLVTSSGQGTYNSGVGFGGHADWLFHRWDGAGLGLEIRGGSAPFMADPMWWSSAGLKVVFGNTRSLRKTE